MANKFSMNLDHFKKIKEDDNATTLRHTKDNHEIRVAHKALSEQQRHKLSKLELYADGGLVGEEEKPFFSFDEPKKELPKIDEKEKQRRIEEGYGYKADASEGFGGAEHGKYEPFFAGEETKQDITPTEMQAPLMTESAMPSRQGVQLADTGNQLAGNILAGQTAPQATDMQLPPTAAPGLSNGVGGGEYGQGQMQGLSMQGEGLAQQARAQGQLGLQQAQAQQQHQIDLQKIAADHDQNRNRVLSDIAKQQQEIAEGHLDPNRFINNMTTGGRITSALGLILGGMGAGLTHGPNLAFSFLQKQIDEDINAQKTDLGKKENLLAYNYKDLGNLDSAYDKTRMQHNDMLLSKLSQLEGTAKNAAAQGQIQNIKGMILSKQGELADSIAKRQTMADLMRSGDPQAVVTAMDMIDPEKADKMRARMVPGMGFANTPADATKMKDLNADATGARKIIQRLKEINKTRGASISPETRAEAFNLSRTLVGQLNRAFTGGGPMSAQEQELLSEIARNPTSIMSLESSNKKSLDTLEKTLNNKLSAVAQSLGLRAQQQAQPRNQQQPGVQYEKKIINGKSYLVPRG